MSELIPSGGGKVVEQSSSVESSSSEVQRQVGSTKIHEKSSDYAAQEVTKMVQESSTSSSSFSSSSRVVASSSVSSSVTSQRVSSTSVGIESSEENALDANGNQVQDGGGGDGGGGDKPVQQIYEAESSQEYFVREHDGKIIEESSKSFQHENVLGEVAAPNSICQPETVMEQKHEEQREPQEMMNGNTEIKQESIKNTLKEIISEIEEAVVPEMISDSTAAMEQKIEEVSTNVERKYDKQTSTTTLDESQTIQKTVMANTEQIAQELNQVLGNLSSAALLQKGPDRSQQDQQQQGQQLLLQIQEEQEQQQPQPQEPQLYQQEQKQPEQPLTNGEIQQRATLLHKSTGD